MKRKTNLFYVDGPDSKFITFSNYTEALTGNFLSTNTKLFPDKFLCLKINNLNISTKAKFIKYLVRYYENKLATLRDYCINPNNELSENFVLPLAYLLEAIIHVCEYDSEINEWSFNNDFDDNIIDNCFIDDIDNYDDEITNLITYVGDITEQDYNGTYTDTICTINASDYYIGTIINSKSKNEKTCTITDANSLHGWENNDIIFNDYIDINPIYDKNNSYYYDSSIDTIECKKIINPTNDIKFNIIIPLFSITNMNYNTNTNNIKQNIDTDNKIILLKNNSNENGQLCERINVPLGIWIHGDEESDSFIELKRDSQINMYPAWSLLISSQFKPFPYSLDNKINNESQNGIMTAYPTFAEILSKINDVLDKFNQINVNISALDNRITKLDRQINEIGTQSNFTKLESKLLKLTSDVRSEVNEFKKQLYGYVDNITWSNKYKNNG